MDALARQVANAAQSLSPYVTKDLAQKALESNQRLHSSLVQRAHKLTAKLEELDKLITAADVDGGDEDLEPGIRIPGAQKVSAPITVGDLSHPDSPFYAESMERMKHLNRVTIHPMNPKELDVLAQAVQSENQRIQAYASQSRSRDSSQQPTIIDLERNTEGIDWTIVAEKVSNASNNKRTASECRIKWIGDRHPDVNHSEWLAPEQERLKALLADHQRNNEKIDWVEISKQLGTNRTPLDCMRNGIPRKRHVWNPMYDAKLREAVDDLGNNNWNAVAIRVSEDATASQCQARWTRTLDPSLTRGAWSEGEDERLKAAVSGYGHIWVDVATAIPGRNNDQCRERWTELTKAKGKEKEKKPLKETWTEEEDRTLLEVVGLLGSEGAWKGVCEKVGGGRSAANCRSRYLELKGREGENPKAGPSQSKAKAAKTTRTKSKSTVQAGDEVNAATTTATATTTTTTPGVGPSEPLMNANEGVAPPNTKPRPRPKPRAVGKFKDKGKEKEREPEPEPSEAASINNDRTPSGEPASSGERATMGTKKRTGSPIGSEASSKKKRVGEREVDFTDGGSDKQRESEAPSGSSSAVPVPQGTRDGGNEDVVITDGPVATAVIKAGAKKTPRSKATSTPRAVVGARRSTRLAKPGSEVD